MRVVGFKILVPKTITTTMIGSATTLAEPGEGETEWVEGSTYAVGDQCIRAETHRVYLCVQDHTERAVAPENDAAYWLDYAPTNRYAAFDDSISTVSTATGSLRIDILPGFFNALAIYGIDGERLRITLTADAGATVLHNEQMLLHHPPSGWYDWLFGIIEPRTQVLVSNLTPYADALLTLELTASSADAVCGIGMVALGDFRDLMEGAQFGGTLGGSTAEPVDYSSIKTDEFGRTVIKRRRNAVGMRADAVIPRTQADYALACIRSVLGVPAVFVAVGDGQTGFDALNCFGLLSAAPLRYDSNTCATINFTVQGMI